MGLTSSIMTITQALTPELAGEERVVTAVGFYGGTLRPDRASCTLRCNWLVRFALGKDGD